MLRFVVGLAVIGGVLWWSGSWPFDGSYNLPQRKRGQHNTPGAPDHPQA